VESAGALLADARVESTSTTLDVTDPGAGERFITAVIDAFGEVDGVVTSAGISGDGAFVDLPLHEWGRVLNVNLTGTFTVAQAAARAMIGQGRGGSIVTVSSALAVTGRRLGAHYASSKAAVIALTKTMALELSPFGIRVNAVAPGPTDTPLIQHIDRSYLEELAKQNPLGRLGHADDQAAAICFLLSGASSWMTGQTMHVNGGSVMP
jgi:3-oxoacyl-[acyl-carrier protein] reductase